MNKLVIEMTLNAEITEHLRHETNQKKHGSNSHNGYSKKTVISDDGKIILSIPRDRESDFEPQFVKKLQTQIKSIIKSYFCMLKV